MARFMFDKFFSFLGTLADSDGGAKNEFSPDDPRLCAAALMYYVIHADGVLREVEIERLEVFVRTENEVDGAELRKLLRAAKLACDEAVDLFRFTSSLMRSLDKEQRLRLIELLWELVYSDGVRHELEDNVVWRISELLGIDSRERVSLRQRVQERTGSDS